MGIDSRGSGGGGGEQTAAAIAIAAAGRTDRRVTVREARLLHELAGRVAEYAARPLEGEKRRLWIPENMAYSGAAGAPAGLLVFDVELISFE